MSESQAYPGYVMATKSRAAQPSPEGRAAYDVIAEAIREWVLHHPYPDDELYVTLSDRPLSLGELLEAVIRHDEVGREFVQSVRELAEIRPDIGIDGVLNLFREPLGHDRDVPPFRPEI
jgi:hypothetical protein